MLGCFNPNLGQIWYKPVGLKKSFKNLTQHLGWSIFDPNLHFSECAILKGGEVSYLNSSLCKNSSYINTFTAANKHKNTNTQPTNTI